MDCRCGRVLPDGANFCPVCGAAAPTGLDAATAAGATGDGERRHLTVLFADLADSTALFGRLDPEDLRALVRSYYGACARAVEGHGGMVGKWLGDGMLAYFSFPTAHEDDAQRAVRAALEIADWAGTQDPVGGMPIAVRLGIHSGVCIVGELGAGERVERVDAVGETPSIAARLQGVAPPNGVVVSGETWRLVAGYFSGESMGRQELKGVADPVEVWTVLGESGARSRLDAVTRMAPLVGREAEMDVLATRWQDAADGHGQVVFVSGEPGIGKSRLARALHHRLLRPHIRIEWWASERDRDSALFPLREHIRRQLDTQEGTPGERLDALVRTSGLDRVQVLGLFAALADIAPPPDIGPAEGSPEELRRRTYEAAIEWLGLEARRLPVLFIVEDLQWMDPSTVELLTELAPRIADQRVLMVVTSREEDFPPTTMGDRVTHLRLERLDRSYSTECVQQLFGGYDVDPRVLDEILATADGVPLFIEELTTMLLESGQLQEHEGLLVPIAPVDQLAIPTTLQDSLMARIDRLGETKALAQMGATVGRSFSPSLVAAVSDLPTEELERQLGALVASGLLYRRGPDPSAEYVFRHALIQDAAYQALLKTTRQEFHQKIATALTSAFPDVVLRQPELVAHHLERAGRFQEAIQSWQVAFHKAMERSASKEALRYVERIERLIDTFPDPQERTRLELNVRIWQAVVNMPYRGYATEAVGWPAARAVELAELVGEPVLEGLALLVLYAHYHVRGEHTTALEIGTRHEAMCHATGDPATLLESDMAVTGTYSFMGRTAEALERTRRGRRIYQELVDAGRRPAAGVNDPGVVVMCYEAQTLWRTGWPDSAVAMVTEARELATEIQHPHSIAWANCFAAEIHELRGEWALADHYGQANIELERNDPFPHFSDLGWVYASLAQLMLGGPPDLTDTMALHLERYNDANAYLGCTYVWGLLALAYLATGRHHEGLAVVDRAEERLAAWGECYSAPDLAPIPFT